MVVWVRRKQEEEVSEEDVLFFCMPYIAIYKYVNNITIYEYKTYARICVSYTEEAKRFEMSQCACSYRKYG